MRLYVEKKDNLVLAGNKRLIILCIVFGGKWGSSDRPNPWILAKFCNTANSTGGNYKVNKYRMVFIRLTEIYGSSVFARSERSRVGEKRHPCGDCTQRPQRSTRKRRAHLHETADGECECHNILLSTFCSRFFMKKNHNRCVLFF